MLTGVHIVEACETPRFQASTISAVTAPSSGIRLSYGPGMMTFCRGRTWMSGRPPKKKEPVHGNWGGCDLGFSCWQKLKKGEK